MLKILQPRLQQCVNHEDVQARFRKGRETRDQIANIHWIIEKAREFQINICFTDYTKAFDCVDHNKLENSSRDGNTRPPYLSPEKSVCSHEATVRTGHGTTDWFQIGKGAHQGCILSPCLFNFCAEYIMRNTGLGSLSLLQQIFPTQELNQVLLHCRRILYQLSYEGSPQLTRNKSE